MITGIKSEIVGAASQRVAFICVNGILTNPGSANGWTDRAVTWLNVHTRGKAEKFEYATDPITRRLWQGWRAQAIARMASVYVAGGYEIVFIGHSNGCELIAQVITQLYPVKFRSAHLFAPATDGAQLGAALNERQLGTVHLYGSANDFWLKVARFSRRVLGRFGLGYGDLGLRVDDFAAWANGPSNLLPPVAFAHRDDSHGHGTWFTRGKNFELTMRAIVAHEFGQEPDTLGSGWPTPPTVTLTGGAGLDATANVSLTNSQTGSESTLTATVSAS